MHQIPIYFNYKGIECKALLDGILIDHHDKTIEPFDLKTTSKSVFDFTDSFLQYGYYRQCAFYEQALLSDESPIKHLLDEGYKLLDYIFIVTETNVKSTRPAVIYKTTELDRLVGLKGGLSKGRHYPGVDNLLSDYIWHTQNDYWDMPKFLLESRGIITLNIFNE